MFYLIANWKANKNLSEALQWANFFKKNYFSSKNVKIIICPPLPLIYPLKENLKKLPNLYLGTQDLSFYEEGSYTGEVTAKTLGKLVDYAIIGHSERRIYFNETEEILEKKINLAIKYNIEPILCVRNISDKIFSNIKFIAYEPPSAIGTGKNEDIKKVIEIKEKLKLNQKFVFIYGGSVNESNIDEYLNSKKINGLLIGSASLDPKDFINIFNKLKKQE